MLTDKEKYELLQEFKKLNELKGGNRLALLDWLETLTEEEMLYLSDMVYYT